MSALKAVKEELERKEAQIAELEREVTAWREEAVPLFVDKKGFARMFKLKESWVRSWISHRKTNGFGACCWQPRPGRSGSNILIDAKKGAEWVRERYDICTDMAEAS